MFDIGWSELLVIVVVAIVVVGPKELPKLLRTFGHYAGKLRRAAADFQRQFEEAMRESELDEVRKNLENIRAHTTGPLPADKPLMLPKQESTPEPAQTVPAPSAADTPSKKAHTKSAGEAKTPGSKRVPANAKATKTSGAKRGKKSAEPGA